VAAVRVSPWLDERLLSNRLRRGALETGGPAGKRLKSLAIAAT
jgi:hypothetical protein